MPGLGRRPIRLDYCRGGPGVGASGSYLTEDVQLGFTTGKRKVIDVALASQRMTLYEDDEAVWSAPVATGVRGAETPPGRIRSRLTTCS